MKSPIKPPRISNCDAREYVQRREPFIGSNLSATMYAPTDDCHTTRYVVYSYARWPLYIAETDEDGTTVWYQNEENYSVTTSKQAGQARPEIGRAHV